MTIAWIEDWAARGLDASRPATTDVIYESDEDGRWWIADADILLNAGAAWGGTDGLDLQRVVGHELGHVLGLLHPCEYGEAGVPECSSSGRHDAALLNPRYDARTSSDPGDDDRAGLCFLYSAEDCTLYGCPLGYACMAAGCVRDFESEICHEGEGPTSCGGELGDPCVTDVECGSFLCATSGYCTASCPDATCPPGFGCQRAEGVCVADKGTYGDACSGGNMCASSVCISYGETASCTRVCSAAGGCPAGHSCAEVDGTVVCVPPPPVGGCAVSPARRTAPLSGGWLMFLFPLARRARNRAHRRAKEKS